MSDPNAMDTTMDTATDAEPTFTPFTIPERIQQLNEIDKNIAQIMHYTSQAMTSLTPTPTSTAAAAAAAAASNRETFKASMDAFVTTLHYVDVHMKRQILGLEEAGIIDLSNVAAQDGGGPEKADVRPTAVGTVGGLDLGWLNSRGDRVERGMEGELWGRGREFLEGLKGGDVVKEEGAMEGLKEETVEK